MKCLALQYWGSHLLSEWVWFNIYAEIIVNSVSILGNKKKIHSDIYTFPHYELLELSFWNGFIYICVCVCVCVCIYRFDPWVKKIPWRREWLPTSVFLPGEFHGQRSLVSYSSWHCKELDMTKAQHSVNKDHGICSHHFMANRWRNSDWLYFGGLQNHCRWWLQPWN